MPNVNIPLLARRPPSRTWRCFNLTHRGGRTVPEDRIDNLQRPAFFGIFLLFSLKGGSFFNFYF